MCACGGGKDGSPTMPSSLTSPRFSGCDYSTRSYECSFFVTELRDRSELHTTSDGARGLLSHCLASHLLVSLRRPSFFSSRFVCRRTSRPGSCPRASPSTIGRTTSPATGSITTCIATCSIISRCTWLFANAVVLTPRLVKLDLYEKHVVLGAAIHTSKQQQGAVVKAGCTTESLRKAELGGHCTPRPGRRVVCSKTGRRDYSAAYQAPSRPPRTTLAEGHQEHILAQHSCSIKSPKHTQPLAFGIDGIAGRTPSKWKRHSRRPHPRICAPPGQLPTTVLRNTKTHIPKSSVLPCARTVLSLRPPSTTSRFLSPSGDGAT